MKTSRWIQHFQQNRLNRPEPDWAAPLTLDLRTNRRCLTAIGGTRAEYFREVTFEISRFLRRLFNPAQTREYPVQITLPSPATS